MLVTFFRLLSVLPLAVLQRIGGLLGRLVLHVSPAYRRTLRGNLRQAGLADPALVRRAADEAGKGALELAFVWMKPQSDVLARTRTTGWDVVEAARREGRGIVFLTPHLGCFEVTAQCYANNATAPSITLRSKG